MFFAIIPSRTAAFYCESLKLNNISHISWDICFMYLGIIPSRTTTFYGEI